jgi:hypothetical protein
MSGVSATGRAVTAQGGSPLTIIGMFIALSEVTAGAAAIGTDGASQLILAVFAVSFPVAVFGVFLWLLLTHPANLYPPNQYTSTTTIESYAAALQRSRGINQVILGNAIVEAVSAAVEANPGGAATREDIAPPIAEAVGLAFKQGGVTVHIDDDFSRPQTIVVPVLDSTPVQDLLDQIYFALAPDVPPFSYGKQWALQMDSGETRVFDEIGSAWSRRNGFSLEEGDYRPLSQVGIEPGSVLQVIRLQAAST